jgi:peroxiredoxin
MAVIAAGRPAPEFSLARAEGAPFTRADLQGQRTLLVFYPFAFSPVCTDQLGVYNDLLGDFSAQGLTLYGVSCDGAPSQ